MEANNITKSEIITETNTKVITIGSKKFTLNTESMDYKDKFQELNDLKALVEAEKTHYLQWKKQLIVFTMIACVIVMNLFLGSSSNPSIVGIKECSVWYFLVEASFVLICICVTYIAIAINRQEQQLKIKHGVNFEEGEPQYEGKSMWVLVTIGMLGGFVAGAFGLGGGSIYNPAFLTLGVHPQVASSTGMYLVMVSTINTCFVNYLNGYLNFYYALWISSWSLIGSLIGMASTDKVVKMTGKPSLLVWVLVFVFVISLIATPIFGGFSLKQQAEEGTDIYKF